MQKNMQQFLTSVEIAPKGRIAINDLQSARIFSLNIYDSSYIPLYSYSLDGEVFVDDGSQFDEFANDGIYTFTQPLNKPAETIKDNVVFRSNEFNTPTYQKGGGVKIGCELSWNREGTSLFVDSCNTKIGCVWLKKVVSH